MMQAFIIKCAELMWMSSELGAKYFAGYQPFINLTVGRGVPAAMPVTI